MLESVTPRALPARNGDRVNMAVKRKRRGLINGGEKARQIHPELAEKRSTHSILITCVEQCSTE